MSYEDRYGITDIRKNRFYNLSISWDYDNNEQDLSQRKATFLFTIDAEPEETWWERFLAKKEDKTSKLYATDHHHIELTHDESRELRDWLIAYHKEVDKG